MRSFAIVPAAGQSRRMGRPKLLLPWGRWPTLLDAVLVAWRNTSVHHICCVARADDLDIQKVCLAHHVDCVAADPPPPEMKASVARGLDYVERQYRPEPGDAWLLAPADQPHIDAALVARLLDEHRRGSDEILVPVHGERRGHPVLFPWPLATAVHELADDEGVNAIVRRGPCRHIAWTDPQILEDIDTPEDYERLRPDR